MAAQGHRSRQASGRLGRPLISPGAARKAAAQNLLELQPGEPLRRSSGNATDSSSTS